MSNVRGLSLFKASLHFANALEICVARSLVHTLVVIPLHELFPALCPRRARREASALISKDSLYTSNHTLSRSCQESLCGMPDGKDSFGPRTLATVPGDSGSTATDSPFPGRGRAGAQTCL